MFDSLSLLAQAATVPANQVPTEWWVPLISAILVVVWDILKRKLNLVEPVPSTPAPVTPPVVVTPEPTPTPVIVTPAPQRPILEIAKELLPVLLPLLVPALLETLKPKAEK